MVARASRRLPGFRFEAQSQRLIEALPRMDVAVFVGFAASGPLDTPVAIDDPSQFAAIFGEDATLLWDKEGGGSLQAHLAPVVRSFLRNGGRRCWVVRVAGDQARSNSFPVPGLAAAQFNTTGKLKTSSLLSQSRVPQAAGRTRSGRAPHSQANRFRHADFLAAR